MMTTDTLPYGADQGPSAAPLSGGEECRLLGDVSSSGGSLPHPEDSGPADRHTAPRSWVIELPWPVPPVKPNGGHGSVYAHAAKVKQVRQVMGVLARNAGLPRMGRCEVLLVWHVGDRIARDVDNLAWTLKPLCDALSSGKKPWDHVIVPGDTPEHMVKPMPVIEYVKGQRKRMTLTVTELCPCPA